MPRVKLGREDSSNLLLIATISKYMVLREIDIQTLAVRTGVCPRTLHSRMKEKGGAEKFKLCELRKIIKALSIPMDEIVRPLVGLSQ